MQKQAKEKKLLFVSNNSIHKYILNIGLFIMAFVLSLPLQAKVKVEGTPEQKEKVANWLSRSLETNVTIGANGEIAIADGGNASATRLRNMINDQATSVTIELVENDPNVTHGRWVSSTADPKGPSTGTQKVDVGDLEAIGNVINSYGFTPDFCLMHEITEVYHGVKDNLRFEAAHTKGIEAEEELMTAHNTELIFRRVIPGADGNIYGYAKIKRPDGTYVVVRFKLDDARIKGHWFREAVPCRFEPSRLIAIADPDPQVHIFNYNYDLDHTYLSTIDKTNSRPTGVAFDKNQNIYVAENHLEEKDEIRVFSPTGTLINTFTNPQLINPEGIDVDQKTGDVFVAVQRKILRFDLTGQLLGSYFPNEMTFHPTDVSVWRNYPAGGIYGDGNMYDIFVTDKATSQVYRFNVLENMNNGTYINAFGSDVLKNPEGIYVDDWWTVWVASTGNNRIYTFTPSGNIESFVKTPYFIENTNLKIYDMVKVLNEGVYVLDGTTGKGNLLLYDFNGMLIRKYGGELLQCPTSLAVNFLVDFDNLVSIPDPGDDQTKDGSNEMLLYFIIAVALILIIYIIYSVMKKRN